MSRACRCLLRVALLLAFVPVTVQDVQGNPEDPDAMGTVDERGPDAGNAVEKFLQWDRATGDWGGLRSLLEERGLSLGGGFVFESTGSWSGGLSSRESNRQLLTVDLDVDLASAVGWPGARAFCQYLSFASGGGGSADVGDIQVSSNVENDRSLDVVSEAWLEQQFPRARTRLKLGKVDANSEFAQVEVAADFAHSSAGFSPTIVGFPSYPDPATSVNLFVGIAENLSLGYGLYDGAAAVDAVPTGRRGPSTFFDDDQSDDLFHVSELELSWPGAGALHEGSFAVGGWFHGGEFTEFDGDTDEDTAGIYLLAQQGFFPVAGRTSSRCHAFCQFGWADEDVSPIGQHIGGGLVVHGPLPVRPDDSAGVYVSFAVLSDALSDHDELAIDTYYQARVAPFFFVQPELQIIFNPSGDTSIDTAVVAGIRVGIDF